MRPASYYSGFAPRDGRPAYPSLWRGCVGAWCPSLGPTGATLRDWGGRGNHAALSNFDLSAAWPMSGGTYSLFGDGTDSTAPTALSLRSHNRVSLSLWFRRRAANAFVAVGSYASNGDRFGFDAFSDGIAYLEVANGANSYGCYLTNDSNWHHLAMIYNGTESSNSARLLAFHDGIQQSLVFGPTIPSSLSGSIGTFNCTAFSTRSTDGNIDDIRVYDRTLSPQEIALLASRRGIAYELGRRRVYRAEQQTFNAAWARGSNVILGAGVA